MASSHSGGQCNPALGADLDAGADDTSQSVDFDRLAQGLSLAGLPLQPPHLHHTGWKDFQIFSAEDDPDRVREPWKAPAFAQDHTAAEANTKLTRIDEMKLPRYLCAGPNSFARIVHGVLDEAQCQELIAAVNAKGFTPALLNVGGGYQQLKTRSRDGHRVIVDSPELAGWLVAVLAPHLPVKVGAWKLVDLNERFRFLCYTPGQHFPAHLDGEFERPQDHQTAGAKSKVTVQIYLHDVPPAYGGATTFFPGTDEALACRPRAGSALLFTQDLEHEGSLVCSGLKYTVRTEAMYLRS